MSVLQLRRFLRTIGQPTDGLKPALTARVDNAVSSGVVKSFVDNMKEKPREAVECGKFLSLKNVLLTAFHGNGTGTARSRTCA